MIFSCDCFHLGPSTDNELVNAIFWATTNGGEHFMGAFRMIAVDEWVSSEFISIWMWIISFHETHSLRCPGTRRPCTIPYTITFCAQTFSSNGMRWTPQRTKHTHSARSHCAAEMSLILVIIIIFQLEEKELDKRQMVYRVAVRLICSITSSVLSPVPHRSMLIATIKILSYHTIYIFSAKFSGLSLDGWRLDFISITLHSPRVHSVFETGTEWNTMYRRLHFDSRAVWRTMPKQSSPHRCHFFSLANDVFSLLLSNTIIISRYLVDVNPCRRKFHVKHRHQQAPIHSNVSRSFRGRHFITRILKRCRMKYECLWR